MHSFQIQWNDILLLFPIDQTAFWINVISSRSGDLFSNHNNSPRVAIIIVIAGLVIGYSEYNKWQREDLVKVCM